MDGNLTVDIHSIRHRTNCSKFSIYYLHMAMQSSLNGKDSVQWRVLNRTLSKESNSQKGGEGPSPGREIKHTLVGALNFIQFALSV